MKKHALVLLCLPLLWAQSATAGPSVELRVRGMIKPAACALVFTNGNTVDLGSISKNLLNKYDRTLLTDENLGFTISCDAPTMVVVDLKDQRPGTAAPAASLKEPKFLFGLGKVKDKNVGAYTLSFDEPPVADGKTVRLIAAEYNSYWDRSHPFMIPNRQHSWTHLPGSHVPTPFSMLTGVLVLAPSVVPSKDLPGDDEIPLDGLASFELSYL